MTIDWTLPTELYDLRALGKALPSDRRYQKLKGLIEQAMSARSAQSDLIHAKQHADLLIARLTKRGNAESQHSEAMIDHAILAHSIILYARATNTRSRHRVTFADIDRFLTTDEAKLHKQICDLRDNAIAHFGSGPMGTGFEWATEAVVLIAQANGFRIGAVSRRALSNQPFAEHLRTIIERMRSLIETRARELSSALVVELDLQANKQQDFKSRVQAHGFDLVAHMGSAEAAADVLRGLAVGYGTGFSAKRS